MIDNFAMFVSHGLIALMVWRLLQRPDLDADPDEAGQTPSAPRDRFAGGR